MLRFLCLSGNPTTIEDGIWDQILNLNPKVLCLEPQYLSSASGLKSSAIQFSCSEQSPGSEGNVHEDLDSEKPTSVYEPQQLQHSKRI